MEHLTEHDFFRRDIICVERPAVAYFYQDGSKLRLNSLVTIKERFDSPGKFHMSYYDVDWSDHDRQYIYNQSGGGSCTFPMKIEDGPFWVAKRVKFRNPKKHERVQLPKEFNGDPLKYLQTYAHEGQPIYCSVCESYFPDDDHCRHIWWCDDNGWYSTPDERFDECQDEDCICSRHKSSAEK